MREAFLALFDRPAEAAWDEVAAAYGEAHRRYHTLEHVAEMLAVLDRLPLEDALAVRLTAWFHDLVYDPRRADNEAASAARGAELLQSLGVADATVATTVRLIELTAGHRPAAGDVDGCAVADADLAILGSPPERYRRYVADVRAEYGWLDDDAWRRGRTAVVEGFLARPRIYVDDRLHAELDARARLNLTSELS